MLVFIRNLLFLSLTSSVSLAGGHNIFGSDDRQQITSDQYPWSTIGYLTGGCTATLVAKNFILTAAHCVFDEEKKLKPLEFYANLVNGNTREKAYALRTWYGTDDPNNNRAQDWAIILLNTDLGNRFGWMGVSAYDWDRVTLAGYSADNNNGYTATAHIGCTIMERIESMWFHDCDCTRGSSGGPVFGMEDNGAHIVALEVAEYRNGGEVSLSLPSYSKEYANIAIPAKTFLPTLVDAISQNP